MKTRTKVHLILSGLLMIATGIIIICDPTGALVSLAWLYGILTLISGVSSLVYYIGGARYTLGGSGVLFRGIIDIVLGIVFLLNKYLMAGILPVLFAIWLTAFGIERIARAADMFRMRYKGRWPMMIIGVVSTATGVVALFSPVIGEAVLSVILGVGFILQGIGYLLLLIDVKKLQRKVDLSDKDEYIVD